MSNPLYGESGPWLNLLIQEQLEYIRKHLCTGPCGQGHKSMEQNMRINAALKAAIVYLNESVKAKQ